MTIPSLPIEVYSLILDQVLAACPSFHARHATLSTWSLSSRITRLASLDQHELNITSSTQLYHFSHSTRAEERLGSLHKLHLRIPPDSDPLLRERINVRALVAALVHACRDLKGLHLVGSDWHRGRTLWEDVRKPSGTLVELSLGDVDGVSYDSQGEMILPAIATRETILRIASLPLLRHLTLNLNWDDSATPFTDPSLPSSSLPRLITLNASIWGGTRPSLVLRPLLLASASTLKELVLGGQNHAYPTELSAVLRELTELEVLRIPKLRGHWLLTNGALSRLSRLRILECHLVTPLRVDGGVDFFFVLRELLISGKLAEVTLWSMEGESNRISTTVEDIIKVDALTFLGGSEGREDTTGVLRIRFRYGKDGETGSSWTKGSAEKRIDSVAFTSDDP